MEVEKMKKSEAGIGEKGVATPLKLKELDRLRLERLNLLISNINLQLALLNERARALQIETAGYRAEREGLVNKITEGYELNGKWRLNPDTMTFEQTPNVGAGSSTSRATG
ncbi:MAG: hypothetical protein QMD05_09275 [Candidatus Brocadiaceae bacterium]|nr:hypothetical protein [Candidatus Brocadiaceae bacterium]